MSNDRLSRLAGRERAMLARLALATAGTSEHAALALAVATLRSPLLRRAALAAALAPKTRD